MRAMAPVGTVVATRYHNVMCALKLSKPTMSIGYAAKHDVLMADMGLSEFCQSARSLDVGRLIEQFTELESRSAQLRRTMAERNGRTRGFSTTSSLRCPACCFRQASRRVARPRSRPQAGVPVEGAMWFSSDADVFLPEPTADAARVLLRHPRTPAQRYGRMRSFQNRHSDEQGGRPEAGMPSNSWRMGPQVSSAAFSIHGCAPVTASISEELQMATTTSRLGAVLRDPSRIGGAVTRRLQAPVARWGRLHDLRWRLNSRQALFTQVYESDSWGSRECGSGTGSELRATDNIRRCLPDLLSRLDAQSVLDAPCGDWNWMRHIDLPIKDYYGVDIVPRVIEGNELRFGGEHRQFTVSDITRDALPRADVILCRDCLVHVSFQECSMILENFRSTGATWLLLNTYPEVRRNLNQFTGKCWRRLNFRLPPFEFPEPVEMFPDGGEIDPSQLALWRLQELHPMQAVDRGRHAKRTP